MLYRHAIQNAASTGSGILRLCADAANGPLHDLATETHFSQLGRYLLYQADTFASDHNAARFRPAVDESAVRAFLESSPHFAHVQRSLEESRTWYLLNPERLRERMAGSSVYSWHNRASLDGVIIFDTQPQNADVLKVAYLDAAVGSL